MREGENTNHESTTEDEDEYVVERIVSKRVRDGRIQYRVKWLGYSNRENTCHDVCHLSKCTDLIGQYERARGNRRARARLRSITGSVWQASSGAIVVVVVTLPSNDR